jgi:DNA repair exonuclease SbcCD ATPase subunit
MKRLKFLYTIVYNRDLMKDYGKVKTFRVTPKHERLLQKCFDTLHIKQSNFNQTMVSFIETVSERLDEANKLEHQTKDQQKEIEKLTNKIERLLPPKELKKVTKQKQVSEKLKEETPEGNLVWCLNKEDWVDKTTECKKCGSENFKMFSDCYAARNRIRLGKGTEHDMILFKPSKPKPNFLQNGP